MDKKYLGLQQVHFSLQNKGERQKKKKNPDRDS